MSRPTRVLYTLPNFDTAGSGQLLLHIVSNLDKARFEPSVCVARLADTSLENALRRAGVSVFAAPSTVSPMPRSSLLLRAFRNSRQFRDKEFEIWHSFHYIDDYTEPLVARFSGARAWVYTKKSMSWNKRSWWLRSFLANGIAAQNRDMLKEFFGSPRLRSKARYVPSGVDVEAYSPSVARTDSTESLRVGCVAHLLPVKGQTTLVQAAAQVPGIDVLLAGRFDDGEYTEKVRSQIEELDLGERVSLVGMKEDIPEFLRSLDIFVLPSLGRGRMEGCPVALLEAMSSGVACIATDIPGSHDLIESDKSGFLVTPEDPEGLAMALRRLVSSPRLRRRLGEEARRRCKEQFSTAHEAQRYMALYDEVLAR